MNPRRRSLADRVARRWRTGGGALDFALAPLELVYRAASGVYHGAYDADLLSSVRAAVPVVSVGNLLVGGAGKTPIAGWLAARMRQRDARPAVLHGGYGDDEPALHRRWHPEIPVYVGRDRSANAARAADDGCNVLVLDDGFQHRRLARDLDLVLVPAEGWSARPRLLPRGPWREPPRALGRADVVAVTRKVAGEARARSVAEAVGRFAPDAEVVRIGLLPRGWRRWRGAELESAAGGSTGRMVGGSTSRMAGDATSRVERDARRRMDDVAPPGETIAVAGVARPHVFAANAREAGAEVVETLRYADHHDYAVEDAVEIRRRSGGRAVVTTEKDAIKLGRIAPDLELWVLEQEVRVEAGREALERALNGLVE